MKTLKIIIIVVITFVINSCSEESVIEGLVPTKPVVLDLNFEVPATQFKTLTFLIDEDEYKLKLSYYKPNPPYGEHDVYIDLIVNNSRFIKLRRNTYLALANNGTLIDKTFFNANAYTQEVLLWIYVYQPQSGLPDLVYNKNGSAFDKLLYIPFTVDRTTVDAKEKNIFGWMSATVTKTGVTIHKIAYIKNTSINAGQE